MIPAWIWTVLIVTVGCVAALWLGSYLPELGIDPWQELLLVFFGAACFLCAIFNNFPFLLAVGSWIPFFPHPGISSLPTVTYFMIWMSAILFLRLCVKGYLVYRRSFNWALLICFAWVPIRFMMNPVTKLGATAGGTGVSGAQPYFEYVLAATSMIFIGAVLTDRNKIMYFMRWCYIIVFISGIILTICAFVPATGPILVAMGSYQAGDIGDGIQRLVQLPGYGLFLFEVALCPALFRLKGWQCALYLTLGLFMIIVGGNRSALAGAMVVAPVILFLRRKVGALILCFFMMVIAVGALKVVVGSIEVAQIPPLLRCFGIFDERIDKAAGGEASANWRYELWANAWKKIFESPLMGKGFGNLPQHVQSSEAQKSTDFEYVLAGGEAHNGFVNAAYGFGIPFMVALSAAIVLYFLKETSLTLTADKHDPEMLELHAFLAGMFASYPVLIYTAFDLSFSNLWDYVAISCVLSNIPRQDTRRFTDADPDLRKYGTEASPAGQYYYR